MTGNVPYELDLVEALPVSSAAAFRLGVLLYVRLPPSSHLGARDGNGRNRCFIHCGCFGVHLANEHARRVAR
jgi:hypothetical protein